MDADMDMIDKVWEKAYIKMAAYQHKISHYINTRVQGKVFKVENQVFTKKKFSNLTIRASYH